MDDGAIVDQTILIERKEKAVRKLGHKLYEIHMQRIKKY